MKKSKIKKALVLGGSGQIGTPLCEYLTNQDIEVVNIDLMISSNHDLREKNYIVDCCIAQTDFVYFLAYDIGGSKFLKGKQRNYDFLMNNTKIMSNTFELLEKYNKPFIFASSAMTEMPWSPYGNLKKLGEHFTESLGGISTRFWNVYGPEHDELKSHVITDFIKKAKNNGMIDMLTDGVEVRQMLYAQDCSKVLLTLAQNFEKAKKFKKFDVTNGIWSSIYDIAVIIAKHYEVEIYRPFTKDTVQLDSRIEPNLKSIKNFWDPSSAITLKDGIHEMIKYYEANDD